MTDEVQLEVPARAEYVSLLRMLVSSLAADRRELDDERLDDLRLALSEACSLVVEGGGPADGRLVVVCREQPDAFEVEVHDGHSTTMPDPGGGLPAPLALDEDAGVPLELIRALVDDVARVEEDGVSRLRFRILCAPTAQRGT